MAEAQLVMRNFSFTVDLGGNGGSAEFAEVSGFDATYDVAEYRPGNSSTFTPQKFPGLVKYGNVTLKRGVTSDNGFMEWIDKNINGSMQKIPAVTITLTDPATNQTAVWTLRNVFPVKYTGPDLNGNATEIAMETLELAHEGLRRGASTGEGGVTPQ